ncbi:unnamed protein product [Pleuronectes platessa]|uniref:Uncharacterized protein n=1 Tax=Pleuronectes platessa TaxID=8262 RepID=A0A9N7UEW2_PLEPL|nr:unnamed protein product [Pleuronectes platessa]
MEGGNRAQSNVWPTVQDSPASRKKERRRRRRRKRRRLGIKWRERGTSNGASDPLSRPTPVLTPSTL